MFYKLFDHFFSRCFAYFTLQRANRTPHLYLPRRVHVKTFVTIRPNPMIKCTSSAKISSRLGLSNNCRVCPYVAVRLVLGAFSLQMAKFQENSRQGALNKKIPQREVAFKGKHTATYGRNQFDFPIQRRAGRKKNKNKMSEI